MIRTYKTEFPDFGEMDVDIPEGWDDHSNNQTRPCPSFYNPDSGFELLIDYKDERGRRLTNKSRFVVIDDNRRVFSSDVWKDVRAFLVDLNPGGEK